MINLINSFYNTVEGCYSNIYMFLCNLATNNLFVLFCYISGGITLALVFYFFIVDLASFRSGLFQARIKMAVREKRREERNANYKPSPKYFNITNYGNEVNYYNGSSDDQTDSD